MMIDLVTDFERGMDKIDFSAIDANVSLSGKQSFVLNSSGSFSGKAGELIWSVTQQAPGKFTILLMADTSGNKLVDMAIQFEGALNFTAAYFIL